MTSSQPDIRVVFCREMFRGFLLRLATLFATATLIALGGCAQATTVSAVHGGMAQVADQKATAPRPGPVLSRAELEALRQRAERGDAESQFNLGWTYYRPSFGPYGT